MCACIGTFVLTGGFRSAVAEASEAQELPITAALDLQDRSMEPRWWKSRRREEEEGGKR